MDNSYPRQLVPRTTRTQDNSYSGQLVPKTTRTQDNSYPRRLVPRTTRTQDNSYPRQLVPRTTRTLLFGYSITRWYNGNQLINHIAKGHNNEDLFKFSLKGTLQVNWSYTSLYPFILKIQIKFRITDRAADYYKRFIKQSTNIYTNICIYIYIYIHVWFYHSLFIMHKLTTSQFSRVMIINARNHIITLSRTYVYSKYMVPTEMNSPRNIYNVNSDTHHYVK